MSNRINFGNQPTTLARHIIYNNYDVEGFNHKTLAKLAVLAVLAISITRYTYSMYIAMLIIINFAIYVASGKFWWGNTLLYQ